MARQHLEQGGFSAAIWSCDGIAPALLKLEINTSEYPLVLVSLGNLLERNNHGFMAAWLHGFIVNETMQP